MTKHSARRIGLALGSAVVVLAGVLLVAHFADSCNRDVNCNYAGQQTLRDAVAVASKWLGDHSTFDGLDAGAATKMVPGTTFTDSSSLPPKNVVSIRVVSPTALILVTSGHGPLCVAMSIPAVGGQPQAHMAVVTYGYADAKTMDECAGLQW